MKRKIFLFQFILIFLFTQSLLATITYTPSQPNVEQEVTFTVINPAGIVGNSVEWDFGDGSILSWNTSVSRAYKTAGSFLVKASYYVPGKEMMVTDQVQITVVERRKITFTPPNPVVSQPVTFRADNFLSTSIRWDFGDGTVISGGANVQIHTFASPGNFIVRAGDWLGDTISNIFTTVIVTPTSTPFLSISSVRLRFEDGSSYKNVVRNSRPLKAYTDIQYEGTGTLQGQWLVDGTPFKSIFENLSGIKKLMDISSGELPTQVPGKHEISLKIINPQVDFKIPIIQYSIGGEEEEFEPELLYIAGKVIYADNSKPIANATVEYREDTTSSSGTASITDLEGKFRIEEVPANSGYILQIYGQNLTLTEKTGSISEKSIDDLIIKIGPIPAIFNITTEKLMAAGKVFSPIEIKTEKLTATGFGFIIIKTEKLTATGKIFKPIVITTEKLLASGKLFILVVIKTEKLTATGKKNE